MSESSTEALNRQLNADRSRSDEDRARDRLSRLAADPKKQHAAEIEARRQGVTLKKFKENGFKIPGETITADDIRRIVEQVIEQRFQLAGPGVEGKGFTWTIAEPDPPDPPAPELPAWPTTGTWYLRVVDGVLEWGVCVCDSSSGGAPP